MKTFRSAVLIFLVFISAGSSLGEETSFQRVQIPNEKGHQVKAVLTFSDNDKAVEVRPAKGASVSIPYSQIDKCSYEYTRKHRINGRTIATAPFAVGAVAMLTKSRSHWLEIDYHDQDTPKVFVVRMDKKNYLRILEALKNHTGKEAEVLGNADKRGK